MFSLKSLNSVTKINVIAVKEFKPATSCVRGHDATTVPTRHMWETGSLNAYYRPHEVVAKVIILLVSVTLSKGGGSASVYAGILPPPAKEAPPAKETPLPRRQPPAKETPQKEAPPAKETPPLGPHPRGKLIGIRSRPTLEGEIEEDQIQAHTQGGNWGGSDPGPHPRGKLRRLRSRPTPKGEIEEDLIQAHTQGGNWGGSDSAHPLQKQTPAYGQWAGGTHPTGMHLVFFIRFPEFAEFTEFLFHLGKSPMILGKCSRFISH